jgi:drug/metabolite transporter (DMT)-like permease
LVTSDSSPTDPTREERRKFWRGLALGIVCALIWGGQAVVSRQSVADGLTAADVTIVRFLAASCVLLPFALRARPFLVGELGWGRALVLTALAGAPYSLVLVGGVAFAPALHSAVVTPGLIPLIATGLAYAVLGERPGGLKIVALGLVTGGTLLFSWEALVSTPARAGAWQGDLLFVLAAAMWAAFGLLSKLWGAHSIGSTATICVLSLLSVPLWAGFFPLRLASAEASAILLQALYQGVLVGAAALFLYTRSVALLGSVRAAMFLPLVPVVAGLAAFLILGEQPSSMEILGTAIVVAGMALVLRPS